MSSSRLPSATPRSNCGSFASGLPVQWARVGLIALADTHCIDDDEVGLGEGIRAGDGLQVGGVSTRVPRPFICSK